MPPAARVFCHILHLFLVGVLLFTPYSRSSLCTTKVWCKINYISVSCSNNPEEVSLADTQLCKIISCCFVLPTSRLILNLPLGQLRQFNNKITPVSESLIGNTLARWLVLLFCN